MRLGPEDLSSVKDAATGSLPATGQNRDGESAEYFPGSLPHVTSRIGAAVRGTA